MKKARRKTTKHQRSRYRTSKYTPNVYDIAVLTGFVILVLSVAFVSLEQPPERTLAGQAVQTGKIICVENQLEEVVCSSSYELIDANSPLLASCPSQYGCVLACAQLTDECSLGYRSACLLQNKFC